MKIILTGAAGFIGSCYLRHLNDLGIDHVWVVDAQKEGADHPNLKGKRFVDYFSREDLLAKIDGGRLREADVVVHLGACSDTTERDRDFLARNNLQYTQRLAAWCLDHNKRFHFASSASVYGDGSLGYDDDPSLTSRYSALNLYGESKLLFDQWAVEKGLDKRIVGFRYFNVFGPNEYHKGEMRSMVCKAFDQIRDTGRVKLFASSRPGYADGSEERDFVYVKDVNRVMSCFLTHPEKNGIFNVGTGKARSFKDLVTAVFTALGKPPAIDFIPMPEKLRGQYQYFTEANLVRLRAAGCAVPFHSLEESVTDYVTSHLAASNPIY